MTSCLPWEAADPVGAAQALHAIQPALLQFQESPLSDYLSMYTDDSQALGLASTARSPML
jgi:hypothetical protein